MEYERFAIRSLFPPLNPAIKESRLSLIRPVIFLSMDLPLRVAEFVGTGGERMNR